MSGGPFGGVTSSMSRRAFVEYLASVEVVGDLDWAEALLAASDRVSTDRPRARVNALRQMLERWLEALPDREAGVARLVVIAEDLLASGGSYLAARAVARCLVYGEKADLTGLWTALEAADPSDCLDAGRGLLETLGSVPAVATDEVRLTHWLEPLFAWFEEARGPRRELDDRAQTLAECLVACMGHRDALPALGSVGRLLSGPAAEERRASRRLAQVAEAWLRTAATRERPAVAELDAPTERMLLSAWSTVVTELARPERLYSLRWDTERVAAERDAVVGWLETLGVRLLIAVPPEPWDGYFLPESTSIVIEALGALARCGMAARHEAVVAEALEGALGGLAPTLGSVSWAEVEAYTRRGGNAANCTGLGLVSRALHRLQKAAHPALTPTITSALDVGWTDERVAAVLATQLPQNWERAPAFAHALLPVLRSAVASKGPGARALQVFEKVMQGQSAAVLEALPETWPDDLGAVRAWLTSQQVAVPPGEVAARAERLADGIVDERPLEEDERVFWQDLAAEAREDDLPMELLEALLGEVLHDLGSSGSGDRFVAALERPGHPVYCLVHDGEDAARIAPHPAAFLFHLAVLSWSDQHFVRNAAEDWLGARSRI